jgi:hypothetical protein
MSIPTLVSSLTEQDSHYLRNDGLIQWSDKATKSANVLTNLTVLDTLKVQGLTIDKYEVLTVAPTINYETTPRTEPLKAQTISLKVPVTLVNVLAGDYDGNYDHAEVILPTPATGIDGIRKTIVAGDLSDSDGVVIHGPVAVVGSDISATNGMEYFAAKTVTGYDTGIKLPILGASVELMWMKKLNDGNGYWVIIGGFFFRGTFPAL